MIKAVKAKKNSVWSDLKKVLDQEKKARDAVDKIKEEMDATRQEKQGLREDLDKLQEEIEVISTDIDALYDSKRKCHETFWKDKYYHKKQREEIMHTEWMIKQK